MKGKNLELTVDGEVIDLITNDSHNIEQDWQDYIEEQQEWSKTLNFSWKDPFDEMMLLRLQAEMYAEQFQN